MIEITEFKRNMTRRYRGLGLILVVLIGCAPEAQPEGSSKPEGIEALVEAERSFSRLSQTTGMRAAFLANLDEDAILYAPSPVPGRPVHEGKPEVEAVLAWEPALAGISRGGGLGYTTGPYSFTPHDTTRAAGYGHYVTLWRKKADGTWRVALDTGIAHPPLDSGRAGPVPLEREPATGRAGGDGGGIEAAERRLAEAAGRSGYRQAFRDVASGRVRAYREGAYPAVGLPASRELLARHPEMTGWEPMGYEVSASGDLGYAYGVAPHASGGGTTDGESSFLRIWRLNPEGKWQIILDLASPLTADS